MAAAMSSRSGSHARSRSGAYGGGVGARRSVRSARRGPRTPRGRPWPRSRRRSRTGRPLRGRSGSGSSVDRFEDRRHVERGDGAEVDDLDGDAVAGQRLGGGDRLVDHPRHRDDGDVGAGLHDDRLPDGHDVVGGRLRALHAVEQPVLDEDHRVRVLDRGAQQTVGVGRSRRHDDGQPGMCASSASRLCECWLPEERPAPNWVRTVSDICAAPPVMNGIFAAWLSNWSRHTPTKSRYISSTTGRIPAIAAPTPRPMTAVSEIGVSRTRSPNRSRSPRVRPKTLPPSPTSMPATNTPSSSASSHSSADRIASIVRKTGASGAGRAGSGHTGRGRVTKSNSVVVAGASSRRAASTAASSSSRDRRLQALMVSSPMPADRRTLGVGESGSRASPSSISSGVR